MTLSPGCFPSTVERAKRRLNKVRHLDARFQQTELQAPDTRDPFVRTSCKDSRARVDTVFALC